MYRNTISTSSVFTTGSPHCGEERHSQRFAPSQVQNRGQSSVHPGQNAKRIGALIPKGVAGGANEITGDNMTEQGDPGRQEKHSHHQNEIHRGALVVSLLRGWLPAQLEGGDDKQPDVQTYHYNHNKNVPDKCTDAGDLSSCPYWDQVLHSHDEERIEPVREDN